MYFKFNRIIICDKAKLLNSIASNFIMFVLGFLKVKPDKPGKELGF